MSVSVTWPGGEGVKIEDREVPPAGADELKVRVEASGLCGTDLHIASGEYPFARAGVTLGHEFTGSVVEVGPGVEGFGSGSGSSCTPTSRVARAATATARARTCARTPRRSA